MLRVGILLFGIVHRKNETSQADSDSWDTVGIIAIGFLQIFNAQMISDSLGVSCYNAGESGCGIILAYGRLLMLLERYTPKTIICEVTPGYDYLDGNDNHKCLNRLKQRYDRPGIDTIFWNIDPTERYKMISGMYRHNSSFLQNLIVYFLRMSTDNGIKGFRPINEEMDTMKIRTDKKQYDSKEGYVYDSLKVHYIDRFMEKTKDLIIGLRKRRLLE